MMLLEILTNRGTADLRIVPRDSSRIASALYILLPTYLFTINKLSPAPAHYCLALEMVSRFRAIRARLRLCLG